MPPPRPPPPPPPNKVLHLGNLLSDTNSAGLNKYFSEIYKLLDAQPGLIRVKILLNHNQIGAYALAYYETVEDATAAMEGLKKEKTPGTQRPLEVTYATSPKIGFTTELPSIAQVSARDRPSTRRPRASREDGPPSDTSLPGWTPNTRGPGMLGDKPLPDRAQNTRGPGLLGDKPPPDRTQNTRGPEFPGGGSLPGITLPEWAPNTRGPGLLGDREFVPGSYSIIGDRLVAPAPGMLGNSRYAPVMRGMAESSYAPGDDNTLLEVRNMKLKQQEELKEKELKERQIKERELKEKELKEKELKERQIKERELKEKELKERQIKERELKEKELKEKELKERQIKERELKEKELKEKELKERQIKETELKEKELKEKELKEKEDREKRAKEVLKKTKRFEKVLEEQRIERLRRIELEKELKEATRKEEERIEKELEKTIQELREKELKENILNKKLNKERQDLMDKERQDPAIQGELRKKATNEVGGNTCEEFEAPALKEKLTYENRKEQLKKREQAGCSVLERTEPTKKGLNDTKGAQEDIQQMVKKLSLVDRFGMLSEKGYKQKTAEENPHVQKEIQVKEMTDIATPDTTVASASARPTTTLTDGGLEGMPNISNVMEEVVDDWEDAF